jgi:hypothetical protein
LPNRRPTAWRRHRRIVPALIAAALAVVAFVVPGLARAEASATILAGHGPAIENPEHGHHCKCRMHCKSACCCVVKDEPQTQAAPAASVPATPRSPTVAVASGPCLKAAPCGGETIPTAAPVVRVGPPAAPPIVAVPRPATAGALLAIVPAALPRSAALARIDEPPESCVRA